MSEACCGSPLEPSDLTEADSASSLLAEHWKAFAAACSAATWFAGVLAGLADAGSLALACFLAAVGAGGATFVPGALTGLRHGRLGVALLMSIAGVGALALGQLGEAAALAFLFSVSEALEQWAIRSSRRGLRAVLQLVPDTVRVQRADGDVVTPIDDVIIADVMIVRAGERIATDGIVREGRSSLDVAAVTGESIPVDVKPGDRVLAGGVNGGGVLEIEVTAPASDSTLARIVQAVEDAQERKGRAQRLADRIAEPLVPGILLVAAAIAVVGTVFGDGGVWVERALVVLVAASPCAFAISVPVTVFASIGAATRAGFVIKGGAAIEALATVDTIALDKTGTLTRNRPVVIDVLAVPGRTEDEVRLFAAALEASSDHPLAAAVLDAADPTIPDADAVEALPGHGISGVVSGIPVRLGRPGFIDTAALAPDVDRLQADGATVVMVECEGITIGALAIRDELRTEAREVVRQLQTDHSVQVIMLSGDNGATASAVGHDAGISDVRGDLLPQGKAEAIVDLQRAGSVAMVGDGINDGPALATSRVGIAMGAHGTDVAIEAADIAIMGDSLTHLPDLIGHARRTRRIMLQNLALSGIIIAVLIPVAGFGILGLGAVVATHEIAEIVVILNALRARRGIADQATRLTMNWPPPSSMRLTTSSSG